MAAEQTFLMTKRIVLLLLIVAATGATVWAVLHFTAARRNQRQQLPRQSSNVTSLTDPDAWAQAVEKVKAPRNDAGGPVETPTELRHYSDRHWFLATQVAEVAKHNMPTCQDFVDLAGMIERGEIVPVPAVSETYVLYGVGAKADEAEFTRYEGDRSVEIYNETELRDAYKRLEDKRAGLESQIAALKSQAAKLKKGERAKQSELQKQLAMRQQELSGMDEDKALLDQFYGQPDSRDTLFRNYQSLQTLAKNFGGRTFNIENPSDRQALKVYMLSALRPEALKILEEIAVAYHRQFDRPLPISSLVRPEQYQHALSRVNRNAVRIETPPHSTGLAFDIDYRYMGAAEQNFVMAELARLKNEGRIEVIRERNANYHVFAFLNGTRPNDELIAASLDEAQASVEQAHHAPGKPVKAKSKQERPKAKTNARRAGKRHR